MKVLITSALPYANGLLHFGHIAGAYLPGDVYARFCRLKGDDVLYLCGSDEHGVAITLSAEKAGVSPKHHVDHYHKEIQNLFSKLNFSFDHYSRTTWPGHAQTTCEFFESLMEKGYVEAQVTDQLYSETDDQFLADRYVVGTCPKCKFPEARGDECQKCGASYEATDLINPRSKVSGAPLSLKPTKHWFLRFDLFKEDLKKWLEDKGWKDNVLNFVRPYIDDLKPRAITRDSSWGIPVPLKEAEGKVFYVWFDAPIGYISAAKEWAEKKGEPDAWKAYWCDEKTKLVQFIGKDNIPFHAIFFPAMIMGQKNFYKLVDELPANEFLNLEGRPFSKSDNWTIDLPTFFEKFTADQVRYYLAANAPESHDAEFTFEEFQIRCNSELLGKFGNLANRILVFIQAQLGGKVPKSAVDPELKREVDLFFDKIAAAYEGHSMRKATALIMELCALGNGYFEKSKPWKGTLEEKEQVMGSCLYTLSALATAAFPIMPGSCAKLWQMIGHPGEPKKWEIAKILAQNLPKPEVLFKKVEEKEILEEKGKLHKEPEVEETPFIPLKPEIAFEDVQKLDLRVGRIESAEAVPKSKKLYKLVVDIGIEKRTIVSGIAPSFDDPSELVDQKVIVVANLKPAKLMGIESEGMILAAGDRVSELELPTVKLAARGAVVS